LFPNGRQLLFGSHAVGRWLVVSFVNFFLQTRDAHHEEFVHDAGKDRQETQPLEQRVSIIQTFRQDLSEKFDEAEFPIQQALLNQILRLRRQGRRRSMG
jgi:hypothetical protein